MLGHHEHVDRRVEGLLSVVAAADIWEREEVELGEIVRIAARHELFGYEQPQQVHARLLVEQLLSCLLPRQAGEGRGVVRRELAPFLEYVRDSRVGPLLFAHAELGVEVVSVFKKWS